jgi:hypothetical protein
VAAKGGLTEFIRMLISKGLKVDEKNIYGQTPFHFAAVEAINLGNTINTKESERFPGISPDGKFLFYFGYTRDIYWVDANIIEQLKPKNLK